MPRCPELRTETKKHKLSLAFLDPEQNCFIGWSFRIFILIREPGQFNPFFLRSSDISLNGSWNSSFSFSPVIVNVPSNSFTDDPHEMINPPLSIKLVNFFMPSFPIPLVNSGG